MRKKILNLLERAASTFGQQFIILLLSTGSAGLAGYQNWAQAADVAGFAAVASLVTSLLTFAVPELSPKVDYLLRIVKTGLQSFASVIFADQVTHSLVHADWKSALSLAISTMAAAAIKGGIALAMPSLDGASLIPATGMNTVSIPLGLAGFGFPVGTVDATSDGLPLDEVVLPDHVEAGLADTSGGQHYAT